MVLLSDTRHLQESRPCLRALGSAVRGIRSEPCDFSDGTLLLRQPVQPHESALSLEEERINQMAFGTWGVCVCVCVGEGLELEFVFALEFCGNDG